MLTCFEVNGCLRFLFFFLPLFAFHSFFLLFISPPPHSPLPPLTSGVSLTMTWCHGAPRKRLLSTTMAVMMTTCQCATAPMHTCWSTFVSPSSVSTKPLLPLAICYQRPVLERLPDTSLHTKAALCSFSTLTDSFKIIDL